MLLPTLDLQQVSATFGLTPSQIVGFLYSLVNVNVVVLFLLLVWRCCLLVLYICLFVCIEVLLSCCPTLRIKIVFNCLSKFMQIALQMKKKKKNNKLYKYTINIYLQKGVQKTYIHIYKKIYIIQLILLILSAHLNKFLNVFFFLFYFKF